MLHFQLNVHSGVPVYRQLMDQIGHYVAAGALMPGDQLPSIRELAKALAVNPTTIVKTYSELEHEGLLEMRHGRGAFVAASAPAWPPERRRDRLQTLASQLAVEARQMGAPEAEALAALRQAFEVLGTSTTPSPTHQSMNEPAITATDLAKSFRGGVIAVNGLDLSVPRGAVYGLIGRNGAGKTTTLRMLMGLLRPVRGTARVLGHDLWTAPRAVRQRVTYVSQEQQLPAAKCTAELCLDLSKLHERWDFALAGKLAKRFGIRVDAPMAALSGGEQRKVAVLLAFAARPDVLVLDEPAAGLDPIARRHLIEEIVEFLGDGGERTVLFSTHIIEDLERVAEHVGIMDRGRMVAAGRLEDLQTGMRRVQLIFSGHAVPDGFRLPGALRCRSEGPVLTAVVRIDTPAQLEALRATPDARVADFPLGLQDLFIELLDQPLENPLFAPAPGH